MQEFMGTNNFIWWHGVVEDIKDPLELGRCRVRCFGFHSGDRNLVPVKALPWATPIQPITSAAISGIGTSPTGLLQGSHVFGFFRDGVDAQQPVMMGSFAKIPQEPPADEGFNDPNLTYPRVESRHGSSIIKEQDVSRLARGVEKGTLVETKKSSVEKQIPIANSTKKWNEPETPYNPIYPKNHVQQSESGHVIEIDDTPDKERLHVYHTSGSFQEVHPDGSKVEKIVKDNYEIVLGDDNVHVSGDVNIMVGGTESNINILVTKDANIQVGGDANMTVDGNATAVIEKNLNAEAKKNVNVTAQQVLALKGAEAVGIFSGGGVFIQDIDDGTFDLRSTNGNVDWTMKGDLNINATGNVTIRGKNIDLNP